MAFMGVSTSPYVVSTNVAGLGTTYSATSEDDCIRKFFFFFLSQSSLRRPYRWAELSCALGNFSDGACYVISEFGR